MSLSQSLAAALDGETAVGVGGTSAEGETALGKGGRLLSRRSGNGDRVDGKRVTVLVWTSAKAEDNFRSNLPQSIHQHLCPFGHIVSVLLEDLTVDGTVEKLWKGVLHRVVVDIRTVNQFDGLGSIGDRFIVARNDLGDGDFMTAVHYALGNALSVDGWILGADKKQTDEESRCFCFPYKFQLLFRGKYCLEYKIRLLLQTFVSFFGGKACGFHYGFG